MPTYIIRTWEVGTVTNTCATTRKQRPAAVNEMWRQTYATLAAFGKLDTVAAWEVKREVDACDDLLPEGEQRSVNISNTGYSVTISRGAL